LAATGALAEAITTLEPVVEGLDANRLPWLRAVLHIDLARLREQFGDGAAATIEAKSALAMLTTLDVVLPPVDVALLDRLGRDNHRPPARPATLAPDGKWWTASCDGTRTRLVDSKGLRYLAELLVRPGTERHVLDLVDTIEGLAPESGPDRHALGDAGELLDSRARAQYRHRIERLRAEADDALAAGLLDEAEAKQDELDQLVAQLAQAFGLGGRNRRAASAAERARLNVTRAVRSAIAKLAEALPEAGAVLDRRVRTGTYCAYEPSVGDDVHWVVRS
jgi:hypothetical protein